MTHGTTTNSGNGYLTEIHRFSKPEAFVPPMRLYTETGCKGRVFLEHGHPRTTRMGSATYIPQFARPFVVSPPLELFDADGRTFRLDLLENYTPGGSIRYWIDANYQPELYPGIDYIGDLLHLLRTSPNDNSAALESLQNTPALGDKSNPTPIQGHQQGFQQGFLNIHERNFEDGNWGAQGQSSGGIGMAPVGPSVYGLEAGNDASRVGNSAPRSPNSSTIPTVVRYPRHSARRSWDPADSTHVEGSSMEQLSVVEAAQARLRSTFSRATVRTGRQPRAERQPTPETQPVTERQPRARGRPRSGRQSRAGRQPRGTNTTSGLANVAEDTPGQVMRGRSTRGSRGTTARRGRRGNAHGGRLHYTTVERAVSERAPSCDRDKDGDT